MPRCGLLGEHLSHSYSPQIHALMGSYEYKLYEKSLEEVEDFIKNGEWDAINVTIPYKKVAAALCDCLSDTAAALGSTNTLVRKDGKIYGYNTDYSGFMSMVKKSGADVKGKKVLVLGSGGASVTVCAVLRSLGANVIVISRSGENNYNNLDRHSDASVIVNTTPVGMYPKNGSAAVDLTQFKSCKAVLDLIYNPIRTELLLQAERLNIPCINGLHMLVAQAKEASELFCGNSLADGIVDSIENKLKIELGNIILIGMPGCGKTEISKRLSEALARPVIDADDEIVRKAGKPIPEIFASDGEIGFRSIETAVLSDIGKLSGNIISTGGGCVTVPENYPLLHQNGIIIWLKRSISRLPTDGRPLSKSNDLNKMYSIRKPMYEWFADIVIDNNGSYDSTIEAIISALNSY